MFHSATGKIFGGQMKLQLSCLEGKHNTMCGEKRHSTPKLKPHPNSKVWWREHHGLGLLCCLRDWTACYHRRKKWIPKFIKTFCRRMLGYLSANWSSRQVGWCNRTTTQNTEVNQQQNGFNRRKYAFWSGPVRVLTSPRFEMLWHDLKSSSHQTSHKYCWTVL